MMKSQEKWLVDVSEGLVPVVNKPHPTIEFLLVNSYIEKKITEYTSIYSVTPKGQRYLDEMKESGNG